MNRDSLERIIIKIVGLCKVPWVNAGIIDLIRKLPHETYFNLFLDNVYSYLTDMIVMYNNIIFWDHDALEKHEA